MKNPEFIDHSDFVKNLIEVKLDYFEDLRGRNWESYNKEKYAACSQFANLEFPVFSNSLSIQGVLRGGHCDRLSWKLITIIAGAAQFVVADLRPDSPTFLKYKEFVVNHLSHRQFLVPPLCPNFHLVLSEQIIFQYQLSHSYVSPEEQVHLHYKDPRFNIQWLIKNPILSQRDK